jgi:hypothetical protein
MPRSETQHVGQKIRWGFDWATDLPTGVTISTSTWTPNPATGLTLSGQQISGSQTSVFVQADAAGSYLLTNHVVLSDGSALDDYLELDVSVQPGAPTPTPYPSAEDLLRQLPAEGDPLTVAQAEVMRQRWINSLEFQPAASPATDEEKRIAALAAMVVEEGTLAALEVKRLRESGRNVPTDLYDRVTAARELRKEYNALRFTEGGELEEPIGYVETIDFGT